MENQTFAQIAANGGVEPFLLDDISAAFRRRRKIALVIAALTCRSAEGLVPIRSFPEADLCNVLKHDPKDNEVKLKLDTP